MSDAIAARWRQVRGERRAALIPYFTAGYPTAAASLDAVRMAAAAGADFIEVGVPFSDPLADGPVIQRSSHVALEGGMTVAGTLELIRDARLPVPVIAFSYVNPVLAYGLDRFVTDARAAGVSGLLLTDLPVGEDPAVERTVRAGGLDLIRLIAPTTRDQRLRDAVSGAGGFIYLISRLGVTGAPTPLNGAEGLIGRVREATSLPIAVGFGLATAAQAKAVARMADGVVVGSALVERLADGLEPARALLTELRAAMARG